MICPDCGYQNPAVAANTKTRTFCPSCGTKLARVAWVAGTAGVTRTIPSTPVEGRARRSIVGVAALSVVLAALAAVVVFGGLLGGSGGTRTPVPTLVAGNVTPVGSGMVVASTMTAARPGGTAPVSIGEPTSTSAGSTDLAIATRSPDQATSTDSTDQPTPETASGTPPGPTPVPSSSGSRFRCETQTSTDPSPTRWRITQAAWRPVGESDRFTLTLVRMPTRAPQRAEVTVELVPIDQVESRFGIPPPTVGDTAIVVQMDDPIRLNATIERDAVAMSALRSVRVSGNGSGAVFAVLGVAGPGCFDLSIPTWDDFADPPSPSELVIEIERP